MEVFNGVTVYWLISLGLLIGYIMDLVMLKRGVGLKGNLFGGVLSSVIIGWFLIALNLYGPLIYAGIGTIAFLFLVNIFSFHQEERTEATTS